jgi:CDP-diacylglycerol--glycerol-3-phosphate 3-phosphatidyltransferase
MDNSASLRSLYKSWWYCAAGSLTILIAGFFVLRLAWSPENAIRWVALPVLTSGYLLIILRRILPSNQRSGENQVLPSLGWGNCLTLLRGLLIAAITGFLFQPAPEGWLRWFPGLLYVLAAAADFFDGYLARVTNHATRLGVILDMSFDGLGVLAAGLLAVQYGQVPAWYLTVAFARPLFIAGLWLRRVLNLTSHELAASITRRIFAGLQMGFLAVILLPIFTPPGSQIAAYFFGLPMLFGFLLDWFSVSGMLRAKDLPGEARRLILRWMPVGLRALILIFSLISADSWMALYDRQGAKLLWMVVANASLVLLVIAGVLPRIGSIIALCLLGLFQIFAPLSFLQISLAASFTALIYLGGGALSLWTPDDALFLERVGERRLPAMEQNA